MRRVYLDEIGCVMRWDNNWWDKTDNFWNKIKLWFDQRFVSGIERKVFGVCSLQTYNVHMNVLEDIYERLRHYKAVAEDTIDMNWDRLINCMSDEKTLREFLGKDPNEETFTESELLYEIFELLEYILGDENKIKIRGRNKKKKTEEMKERLLHNKYRMKYGVGFDEIYDVDVHLEENLVSKFWKIWLATYYMFGW